MTYLYEELLKEEQELNKLIDLIIANIRTAPEGFLRISQNRGIPQYYYRTKDTDGIYKNGEYIKKDNIKLAYELAQRDYDQKILKAAKSRLNLVKQMLSAYSINDFLSIYEKQNIHRQKLINTRGLSDEQYIRIWLEFKYTGKSFADGMAEISTDKGERVRSKSEKIIADMLNRKGIPYRYECPVTLQGKGAVYPDFTVLNIRKRTEIYWEHFGMMDNNEYCENALSKVNSYIKSGIIPGKNLIITYETSKHPLETVIIDKIVNVFLTD